MNIKDDHIHIILSIPPRLSVSELMGMIKPKLAIKIFKSFHLFRKKKYWGNRFWNKHYYVSTIGPDESRIRKYVKYQEDKKGQE